MYLQGQPRNPRRGRGRIAFLAIGALVLTAVGLTGAIRSVDSSPTEATAQPAATAAGPTATGHVHVHATPASAEVGAAVAEAPKS
jgi:hypothetical protein